MSNKYYYLFSNRQYEEKTKMNKLNSNISVIDRVLVNGNWQYFTARIPESAINTYLKRYSDAKIILLSDDAKTC